MPKGFLNTTPQKKLVKICIPNYYLQTAYICGLNYAFYIPNFSKIVLMHFATCSQSSTKYMWHTQKNFPNWFFYTNVWLSKKIMKLIHT